jgi:fucose permease
MVFFHLAFVLVGVITTLLGPLLPLISRAWLVDDGQAGAMLGAQFLASVVGGLASTALAQRFGAPRSLGTAFLVMAAGLVTLLTGRWPLVALASSMWGLGLGLVVPEMTLLIALTAGPRAASALSLFNVMWSTGALLWAATVYVTARWVGPVPLVCGVAALAVCVAVAFYLGFGPDRAPAHAPTATRGEAGLVPWQTAALFALMLFLYGGVENSLGGWVASFVARMAGPDAVAIGAAAPAAFYLALVLGRLSGVGLLGSVSEAGVLLGGQALALAAMVAMLAAPSPAWVVAAAFVAGLGCAVVYPITAAGIAREIGKRSPRIVGPLLTAGGLGSATFPWVVGLVSRQSGSLRAGLAVAATAAFALVAVTAFVVRARPTALSAQR